MRQKNIWNAEEIDKNKYFCSQNAHVGKKCIMHLWACRICMQKYFDFFELFFLPMLPSSEKAATSLAEAKKKKCLKTFICIELNEQSSEFN